MAPVLTVLDLFSGIGGFSLGLERTGGFRTAAFCEMADFPRLVLRKHEPDTPAYRDIRHLTGGVLTLDNIRPDVICGGFPCQDISAAGRGAGLDGERSGLCFEMLRIIEERRPSYVIAENVVALRSRGLDTVLRGLASIGYDAEWHCIPAAAIGAPHRRDRVWILAYPNGSRQQQQGWGFADQRGRLGHGCQDVADPRSPRLPRPECAGRPKPIVAPDDLGRAVAQCYWRRLEPGLVRTDDGLPARLHKYPWRVEPWEGNTPRTVGRGLKDRRGRIMALGNSIVPHIAEMIGRAILRDVQQRTLP